MARPSKLTRAVQDAICDALSSGASLAEACGRVGIGESTALEWLARGRGSHSSRRAGRRYAAFAYAVDAATRAEFRKSTPGFAEFAEPRAAEYSDAKKERARVKRWAPFVHVSDRVRADEAISARTQDYDF